ncbi:MAG: hypothetical protein ACKO37_03275, partial [Vampirovibrionales bacterium]
MTMTITFFGEYYEPHPTLNEKHLRKYSKICKWAWKRYTKTNTLVVSVGGKPSPYALIEQAAWKKYTPQ